MATTSKRTQVLFRAPIQVLLESIAEREGLSASKTVAKLVEEALVTRGLLQKERYEKAYPEGPTVTELTKQDIIGDVLTDPINPKSQPTEVEADDTEDLVELLAMAKKLKALQKVGLL